MMRFFRIAAAILQKPGEKLDSLAVRLSSFAGTGSFNLESESERNAILGHVQICKLLFLPVEVTELSAKRALVGDICESMRTVHAFLHTIRCPDSDLMSRVRLTSQFLGGVRGSNSSLKRMRPKEPVLAILTSLCQEMKVKGDLLSPQDLKKVEGFVCGPETFNLELRQQEARNISIYSFTR